jgi:hypothetical protein
MLQHSLVKWFLDDAHLPLAHAAVADVASSPGISQPPHEMAIPFKRCSHLYGAGTWMD